MLSPLYLSSELPRRMTDLMSEIENEMLARVAYYVRQYGRVTGTAEFLALKQTQYGLLHRDLLKIVAKYSGLTEAEVAAAFTQSAANSLAYDNRILKNYEAAGLFTPLHPIGATLGATASAAAMQRTLTAAINRALDIQNLTNTSCVQSALEAFTRATDKAYLSIVSGAQSFDAATRQAVDEIAQMGLSVVEYDRSGREIHYSVEAATRRTLITSVSQVCGKIQEMNMIELGCYLAQTTSHAGARPSHAAWQGGKYWLYKKVKGFGSLVDDCGYGAADGIKGVNCNHDFWPTTPDAPNPYDRDPAKNQLGIDNDELYYLRQKQRYHERQIRDAKKRQGVFEAAGMTKEAKAAGALVRQRQENIRNFLDENPILRRDYTRERVAK